MFICTCVDTFHEGVNLHGAVNEALNATSVKWTEQNITDYCTCDDKFIARLAFSGNFKDGVPLAVLNSGKNFLSHTHFKVYNNFEFNVFLFIDDADVIPVIVKDGKTILLISYSRSFMFYSIFVRADVGPRTH